MGCVVCDIAQVPIQEKVQYEIRADANQRIEKKDAPFFLSVCVVGGGGGGGGGGLVRY